jgi:hypothetical protein
MVGIIGLGAWQVCLFLLLLLLYLFLACYMPVWKSDEQLIHLRSFFKRKYLID